MEDFIFDVRQAIEMALNGLSGVHLCCVELMKNGLMARVGCGHIEAGLEILPDSSRIDEGIHVVGGTPAPLHIRYRRSRSGIM